MKRLRNVDGGGRISVWVHSIKCLKDNIIFKDTPCCLRRKIREAWMTACLRFGGLRQFSSKPQRAFHLCGRQWNTRGPILVFLPGIFCKDWKKSKEIFFVYGEHLFEYEWRNGVCLILILHWLRREREREREVNIEMKISMKKWKK